MKRIVFTLVFSMFFSGPLFALLTNVPLSAAKDHNLAVEKLENGDYKESMKIYEKLAKKHSENIAVQYGYGRSLLGSKLFNEASEVLEKVEQLAKSQSMLNSEILNTIGWSQLVQGNFETALDYFGKSEAILTEDENIKKKVYNNKGYTLMLLDRYEEAEKALLKAKGFGNEKAEANLEKVRSLRKFQESGKKDVVGIFSVVVASSKYINILMDEKDKYFRIFPEKYKNRATIYLSDNGYYHMTVGGNYSYPRAIDIRDELNKGQSIETYVSSTTSWKRVSMSE